MLVIIPCGKDKTPTGNVVAAALYRGQFFDTCLSYALTLITHERQIRILSAKHGLLSLDDVVPVYDMKMGEANCIGWIEVTRQAVKQDLLNVSPVITLAGGEYYEICKKVWPHCEAPLRSVGPIGKQLQWLKRNTKR